MKGETHIYMVYKLVNEDIYITKQDRLKPPIGNHGTYIPRFSLFHTPPLPCKIQQRQFFFHLSISDWNLLPQSIILRHSAETLKVVVSPFICLFVKPVNRFNCFHCHAETLTQSSTC